MIVAFFGVILERHLVGENRVVGSNPKLFCIFKGDEGDDNHSGDGDINSGGVCKDFKNGEDSDREDPEDTGDCIGEGNASIAPAVFEFQW